MKEYVIRCNEDQLQRLRSAIELQMRIRIGQGWAISENLMEISDKSYRLYKELYDNVLGDILSNMVCDSEGKPRVKQNFVDRDMWIGIECGLGYRNGEIGLGPYGLMKVEEVKE